MQPYHLQTVNVLLSTSEHGFLSLVRDPSQPSFDPRCTTLPVEPFETGFLNYSREQIRDYLAERLPTEIKGSFLTSGFYAILDERSALDNTVVFGGSFSTLRDRDPETMTFEEIDEWDLECEQNPDAPDDIWREFRVRFEELYDLTTTLLFEGDFTQKLYNDAFVAKYTDKRGVFFHEQARLAYVGDWTKI